MSITQFTMEEVRCFSGCQTLEIRPLTFLVGENSTGKTTALACFHVLANYLRGGGVDFNADPYSMGIFKDIVRNSRPKAKTFKLGFTTETVKWTVEFSEKIDGIEPTVSLVKLKFSDGEIVFRVGGNAGGGPPLSLVSFDKKHNYYEINCDADILKIFRSVSFFAFLLFGSDGPLEGNAEGKTALENYVKTLQNLQKGQYNLRGIGDHLSVFSTSPIRSRPKRTYDPTRESNDPEGSDVPMYLMRIEATEKRNWEALKTQLVEFGKTSGLFQNIEVKNLGRSLGAPFQLKFRVRGPNANIVDVGYGVSQILPILVHILGSNPHEMNFSLLQQPEVHLHPKAQAELSSLLARLANEGNRAFIVETHSDYMLDRARIEIIRGNIRPEDVSLIYFEPKGRIVKVHNISFDKMANMVGDPPHYGEFFLKESKRLLGFKD
ncbi:AAA family ATPase [Candidatus Poribacteria bacterium]|nr:AAA family ATPase [Candidatus Poribacteria bacterium]MYH82964.1 AAA family ATPase [Candidatus Poribacteria bacterium]MYK96090.1 AAA family ATPase [Candidatus Poribacteria bacterium]